MKMIFDIVNAILALHLCALILTFKIPYAFLVYFASFLFKNERIPPSLYQRLAVTFMKTFQLHLPTGVLRKLCKLFDSSMFVTKKRWVKKLDEHDGWEGYLIADNVWRAEVGEDVDVVILYAHGGGFVCGDALGPLKMFTDWITAWKLRYGANTQILSVEYGLSPENSFPVARDNMLACYNWLVTEKDVSPSKIIFAGDSAGGNLATVSAFYLINQPYVFSIDPPAALILLSPLLSGVPTKSFISNASYDSITHSWFNTCLDSYVGDSNLVPSCTWISPIFETQFSGFPKVWACVGDYEILYDDIVLFIDKLSQHHIKAELVVEEGNIHDYAAYKLLSRNGAYERSIDHIGKFLYSKKEFIEE